MIYDSDDYDDYDESDDYTDYTDYTEHTIDTSKPRIIEYTYPFEIYDMRTIIDDLQYNWNIWDYDYSSKYICAKDDGNIYNRDMQKLLKYEKLDFITNYDYTDEEIIVLTYYCIDNNIGFIIKILYDHVPKYREKIINNPYLNRYEICQFIDNDCTMNTFDDVYKEFHNQYKESHDLSNLSRYIILHIMNDIEILNKLTVFDIQENLMLHVRDEDIFDKFLMHLLCVPNKINKEIIVEFIKYIFEYIDDCITDYTTYKIEKCTMDHYCILLNRYLPHDEIIKMMSKNTYLLIEYIKRDKSRECNINDINLRKFVDCRIPDCIIGHVRYNDLDIMTRHERNRFIKLNSDRIIEYDNVVYNQRNIGFYPKQLYYISMETMRINPDIVRFAVYNKNKLSSKIINTLIDMYELHGLKMSNDMLMAIIYKYCVYGPQKHKKIIPTFNMILSNM